jgi:DnaJ-class molecular chaperone
MSAGARTCPVCAGRRRYIVRRRLTVASWLGGHYEITRRTEIRCDACDGTGALVPGAPGTGKQAKGRTSFCEQKEAKKLF